jgi:apolipoprotein N-acyltransferase
MNVDRSEVVAAQGVGVGIGLIALMLTWLVGSRIAGLVWEPPVGPVVAFLAAIMVSLLTSIVFARRLVKQVRRG